MVRYEFIVLSSIVSLPHRIGMKNGLLLNLICCSVLAGALVGAAAQPYFPSETWRRALPETQGVDSRPLIEMLLYIRQHHLAVHDITIIRHGYLVFDSSFYPYHPNWTHDVASVTKSITSILIGIAIDRGSSEDPSRQ